MFIKMNQKSQSQFLNEQLGFSSLITGHAIAKSLHDHQKIHCTRNFSCHIIAQAKKEKNGI